MDSRIKKSRQGTFYFASNIKKNFSRQVKVLLLEYSFKNFCSFDGEENFSLIAPKDGDEKNFPFNYVSENNFDIFKTAVIVGENAGGKTNFVKSLSYLKSFFKENNFVRSNLDFINDGKNFGEETIIADTEQKFFISALIENIKYNYELVIDYLGIKEEIFSFFSEEIKINILKVTRSLENIKLTDPIRMIELKYRGDNDTLPTLKYEFAFEKNFVKKSVEEALRETDEEEHNGLNLSKLAIIGIKPAVKFVKWINENLLANLPQNNFNKNLFVDDKKILSDKEKFLPILQMADPSIKDFILDFKEPFSNTKIIRENKNQHQASHELLNDSAGVRDFFSLAIQIYKVVHQDKTFFADEMDRSLNPVLSDKIVAFVNGSEHKGQFIFTTHNAFHLDLKIYMKEQIYFITKNLETLNSELYSLADFSDVSYDETEPIYNFYLRGILGGVTLG